MRILILLTLFASAPALAECSVQSGEQKVPLLELYTSEGCSSCPPADAWLSSMKGTNRVIPLAFHVDYWDYIGWKDRFAQPQFSTRQKQAAAWNGSTFVYTPQVMLNGRDFRGWRQDSHFDEAVASLRQPAAAQLTLRQVHISGNRLDLHASAQTQQPHKSADIYVAVYENKLKSRVNAGENSGRELAHDYVVREWHGPYQFKPDGRWERTISLTADWNKRNAGAVIFAQDRRSGGVWQALSLDFCS